jgi:recombination protein RecA
VGGIPRGRITEIYGPESSGKTTLCLHTIAEAQARGGICAFVDMEHALDPNYAERIGVDVNNLYIAQPDTAEQALEITESLVRSGALDIVVLDSVAALVPKAEIEGEMGDSHVGLQARLMSQALRKLAGAIKSSNAAMIFTNQLREKIGIMFGNPETTSGGRALKFYASVRIDIRRIQAIKQGEDVIGNRTRVKITKNKVASPFRQAEFDIMYNEGISKEGDICELGVSMGIIEKRGAFFRYNDGMLGQGRENAKQFLRENPAISYELRWWRCGTGKRRRSGRIASINLTSSPSPNPERGILACWEVAQPQLFKDSTVICYALISHGNYLALIPNSLPCRTSCIRQQRSNTKIRRGIYRNSPGLSEQMQPPAVELRLEPESDLAILVPASPQLSKPHRQDLHGYTVQNAQLAYPLAPKDQI